MRSILISMLLIVVIITIYSSTIGGAGGVQSKLLEHGEHMNRTIERLNMYGENQVL